MNRSLKIFIVCFSLMLVSVAAVAYVFYGQSLEAERLMTFRANLETWERLNRANANLNIDRDMDMTLIELLESRVLKSEGDTIAFLSHIDDLGRQAGVEVATSELERKTTSESGFDNIRVKLTLRGADTAIKNTIALLEELPYRSRIESLTLSQVNEKAEAVVVLLVSVLE